MATVRYAYPATLETDEDGRVVVSFRDIEGAHTDGADRREALANAPDCLAAAAAAILECGEHVPEPSSPRVGEPLVPLPLSMAAKTVLHDAVRCRGIDSARLAELLGCRRDEAERLLDPWHASKIDRLVDAIVAVGGPALELSAREVA